ncbi:MAG: hypothetical protein M1450_01825 [Patescibacteria group bacterium]|nr:hypothetical protein [Patescibacteria group bacterium]
MATSIELGQIAEFKEPRRDEEKLYRNIVESWSPTGKTKWAFVHPENGQAIEKDVYSVWNPYTWKEVAGRLKNGENCAMMVAGAYGTGRIFEAPEPLFHKRSEETEFQKSEHIKKGREEAQKFCVFMHPENLYEYFDWEQIHSNFKGTFLRNPKTLYLPNNRMNAYGGLSVHLIAHSKRDMLDASIRKIEGKDEKGNEMGTTSFFWIPGHRGFEGIVNEIRRIRHHGVFAGGSLNFHGENPPFTTTQLIEQMAQKPEWLDEIDFILLDEIMETAALYDFGNSLEEDLAKIDPQNPNIDILGRSQTQIKLGKDGNIYVIRYGSSSKELLEKRLKRELLAAEKVKYASTSRTNPGEEKEDYISERNQKVDSALAQGLASGKGFMEWLPDLKKAA